MSKPIRYVTGEGIFDLDNLTDAQEEARRVPPTFTAPTERQLSTLRGGDLVSVCRNGERFWIQLFHVQGTTLYGRVASTQPLFEPSTLNDDLPPQTAVTVQTRHVYQIIEARHQGRRAPY